MAETAAHAACRSALERYASRRISATEAQNILIAQGVPDDPDGEGEAYSAQQAILNLNQGSSVSDVLGLLEV